MLIACWSAKGGSGTTVVAAGLGLLLGRSDDNGCLLLDLGGDAAATLGVNDSGVGLAEWLTAPNDVELGSLDHIAVPVTDHLSLVSPGSFDASTLGAADRALEARIADLVNGLSADARSIVVDCGDLVTPRSTWQAELGRRCALSAMSSLLVVRPCYLALRRAVRAPLRPTGVVVVAEPGRALRSGDIEKVLDVPVRAEVEIDPAVARAVDAGLLASRRLPRSLERALRHAA